MLFPERMQKIELLVLKRDLDSVMRALGAAGCMQLIAESHEAGEPSDEERETAELRLKVQSIARFLDIPDDGEGVPLSPVPSREDLRARTGILAEKVKDLIEEESVLLKSKLGLRQAADEIASFGDLGVPFGELTGGSGLAVRTGTVAPEKLAPLAERLRSRALVLPLARPGQFLAVTPRKGRWALDSELRRVEFQEAKIPEGEGVLPRDMLSSIESEAADIEGRLQGVAAKKSAARVSLLAETRSLLVHLSIDAAIDSFKQGFGSSGSSQRITGWVPRRRCAELARTLDVLTRGCLAFRTFEPEELPEVKAGATRVPVSTPHGRIVRGFDRMVFSYAVPLYGTVDPTPFVAVLFVLLFAIMFGDTGQGLVGLLLGVLINSGWVRSFAEYRRKNFGTVFIMAGAAAMVAGLLYGSFFANEAAFVPATRFVTAHLLGHPMDRIISLEGFQRIILFFGVTIGVGAVINSIGLLINILNTVRRRQWDQVFLSKTGIAGAVFFWYALSVAVRIVLGGRPGTVDFVIIAVPLLAIFFREPILHLVKGHRPLFKEGLFGFVMEGIAEVLESAIYYVSNSVSFLRVAAFALAHTVLSTIIVLLAGMVGTGPAGFLFTALVYFVGNAIIIVLEGLIVTIQVVRLQYYEFFSKFFTETGEQFQPFILRVPGGSR